MSHRLFFALLIGLLPAAAPRAEQLDPIAPGDALATIVAPEDVEIQLVASEPIVEDPVALAFDAEGRMYVVENRGYPTDDSQRGRVTILRDRDGDGYYESRTVFAEGFGFPNGVMPWKGGVLVTSAPAVYFLKDTNGDDIADVREEFLTGFKLGGSTQLYVSHPTLGLDNWLYFTNGLSGGEVTDPLRPDAKPVSMGNDDLSFHPITRAMEAATGRAQFGQSFDNYGHRFVCTNRKHISQVMLQRVDLARNPYAGMHEVEDEFAGLGSETRLYALSDATTTAYSHAGTFTAACGLVIYRGTALPAPYHENGFTCDPTSNIVHRTIIEDRGDPAYHGRRGREGVEFLASTDNWHRPVFLANGPDGALYLCDMYRKTIEHPQYLPKDVAAITDFDSGKGLGRIYRVAAKGSAKPRRFMADAADPKPLVAALAHEDAWQRETAHRLLLTEATADEPLLGSLREAATKSASVHARLHALHLLDGHAALDEPTLLAALADADHAVRERAVTLARPRLGDSGALREATAAAASDAHGRVRYAAALALGDLSGDDTVAPLLEVARRGLPDKWTRAAVLTGIREREAAFAQAFVASGAGSEAEALAWLDPLARMLAQSQPKEAAGALLGQMLAEGAPLEGAALLSALEGAAEGIRRNGAYDRNVAPLAHLEALAGEAGVAPALEAALARSQAVAADRGAPAVERLAAVRLLGYGSFDQAGALLADLLHPRETQDMHQAAVQALGMIADPRVADLLASREAWGMFSTPIRAAALSALLSRPERTAIFLDALEAGKIAPQTIDPISRRQLENHKDAALKERASAIFSQVQTTDRTAVYEEYKSVFTLDPDPVSGREVFKNHCASCHRFQEDGFDVGPDLTGIRSQPRESILLHIIKPNSEVLPGYENVLVETRNFESFSGIIVSENESTVTIRSAMGVENTINREDIDAMTSGSLSLMPEELEKAMSRQEMRDLIGFLKGEGLQAQR